MDEVDKVTSGHGVAAEIVAIADDWARAIAGNDAERIAGVMADERVIVSESGISTEEDFLSVVRSGALTHSAMDRITHPRIRVYGDTAIFTARVTNTAHYGGERFDADEWTTDVFVLRNSRWQCVLSQITRAAAGLTAETASEVETIRHPRAMTGRRTLLGLVDEAFASASARASAEWSP
jgi:ketosteroid isomerase-like protein